MSRLTMVFFSNRNVLLIFIFYASIFSCGCQASLLNLFNASPVHEIIEKNKDIGLFVETIDFRKRQLENLNKQSADALREIEELGRSLTQSLNNLTIEISNIKKRQSNPFIKASESENFNKKIVILNDRIQQITMYQELLREYEISFDEQIKRLKGIIDEFTNEKHENVKEKRYFVLQDLNVREEIFNKYNLLLVDAFNKKESLVRHKNVLQERLSTFKNEYEVRIKEKEKMYVQYAQEDNENQTEGTGARFKFEVLDHEAAYFKDKIEYVQLQLKKNAFEYTWADDEYNRLKLLISTITVEMNYIKKHLIIDAKDVVTARDEWKNEVVKINARKAENNAKKDALRLERDRRTRDLNASEEAYKKYKDAGETKSAQAFTIESNSIKIRTIIKKIDMQLQLLDAHNDALSILVDQKYFTFKNIQIRFKRGHVSNVETINEWINDFKGRRAALEHDIRSTRTKREEALNSIAQMTSLMDTIAKKTDEVSALKETHFRGSQKLCNETLLSFSEAQAILREQLVLVQAYLTTIAPIIPRQEALIGLYDGFMRELEQTKSEFNIWYRSTRAISFDGFKKSLKEGELFGKKLFWAIPQYFNPITMMRAFLSLSRYGYLVVFLFLALFLLLFLFFFLLLHILYQYLLRQTESTHGKLGFIYLNILLCGVEFIKVHQVLLFFWFFMLMIFRLPFSWELALGPIDRSFFIALFFVSGTFIFSYLSQKLLYSLQRLNQKLNYFFFDEQSEYKFVMLLASVFYSSSFLLPLRSAFLAYGPKNSELPEVVLAVYSLILLIILLLFFTKEDVLKVIPSHNTFWLTVQRGVAAYYYPVFLFCMGLFILANPYVGYSHLAWFLAFAVPTSLLFIGCILMVHHYIRQYSLFVFFKEEGEDIVDKFEHAKMYYGFFVIFTFFGLLLFSFVALSYLWGFSYSIDAAWKLIAEEWTIKLGGNNKLGIIQSLSFVLFVISGFLLSSISNHFILNKLFDIFKTDPGAQNTISRIFHYLILVIFVLFGLATIGLGQLILPVSYLLIIGVGLGLKDQIADFFAGFLVLLERQIEIGNFIETGDTIGTVQKIAVRSTTIRTARNLMVIIPNRTLISTPIINYSRHSVAFEIKLLVRHDSEVEIVKSLLFEIVSGHPVVLRLPSPIVRLDEITEVGQLFLLRGFVSARRAREMWDIASDIRIAVINVFKSKKIRVSCTYPLRVEVLEKAESITANVTEV